MSLLFSGMTVSFIFETASVMMRRRAHRSRTNCDPATPRHECRFDRLPLQVQGSHVIDHSVLSAERDGHLVRPLPFVFDQ